MRFVQFQILVIFALVGCTSAVKQAPTRSNSLEAQTKPYVILVSIDGYRSDYTDRYSPPSLKVFRDNGASAKSLIPVFPSKTFTNHYSIATGLYAENHGIVANTFYDPTRKEEYKLSNRKNVEDGSWYGGTPLWVAAEKQGMLAANYFWPGSEAEIQGIRPSYFYAYNKNTTLEERVNQVKAWLELPAERRPHFITVYISDVDTAGHEYGPESVEVKNAVLKVDHAVSKLLDVVQSTQLPVNVVIVSDHGMQKLDTAHIEYLDDYTDLSTAKVLGDGIQLSLYFDQPNQMAAVYGDLKAKAKNFQVFKRDEIPERYHFSKNPRCGDLVVIPQSPYLVGLRSHPAKHGAGGHGYDPDTTANMRGIFYAQGTQIQGHKTVESFRNVHIYPLILKILGLKTITPVDGNLSVLAPIYKN